MKKGQSIKLLYKFNILVADLLNFPSVAASKCKMLSFSVKKQECCKMLSHVLCPKRLTKSCFYGSFFMTKKNVLIIIIDLKFSALWIFVLYISSGIKQGWISQGVRS